MVISKDCMGKKMICENEHCKYKEEPKETYNYWKTANEKIVNCEFHKTAIYATDQKEPLFENAQSRCLARDLYCLHENSITIWDESIIHKCPYYRIKEEKFNITENIMISEFNLFQTTSKNTECGMVLISTTEGVYVTENEEADKLIKSDIDYQNNFHLTLGDVDLKSFKLLAIMTKLGMQTQKYQCSTLKTILKNFKKNINEYFVLEDPDGEEMILYNDQGEVKLCRCIEIRKILIKEEMVGCFNDLQIIIDNNNKSVPAFLTDHGIIRKYSKIVPCNSIRIITTPDNKIRIQIEGTKVKIEKSTARRISINFNEYREEKFNYTHDTMLIENFDLIKEINRFKEFRSEEHSYYVNHYESPHRKNDTIEWKEGFLTAIFSFKTRIGQTIHKIITYFNAIITFLIIVILVLFIFKVFEMFRKKKIKVETSQQAIELQAITKNDEEQNNTDNSHNNNEEKERPRTSKEEDDEEEDKLLRELKKHESILEIYPKLEIKTTY
jgi:hypothetical protein